MLDRQTYATLRRLGFSEVCDGREAYRRGQEQAPNVNPQLELARRKLTAAEALLERGCAEEGLGLLAGSMTVAAALVAGVAAPPSPAALPVWLFSELVPAGRLDAVQAAQVLRADALCRAPQVPPELAGEVLRDARGLLARVALAAP